MAELDSFPNQQPQDSDEVVAAHDSNGDGTLDDTVNWTWENMKAALDSAGYARLSENETVTGSYTFESTLSVRSFGTQIEALETGLSASAQTNFILGRNLDTNNAATIRYYYNGDGAGSNRLELGFFGNDALLNLQANGNVGIGTTSPSYALDTAGVMRAQERLLTDFSDPSTFSAREVKSGTSAPSDSEGKNGDIYIQTN